MLLNWQHNVSFTEYQFVLLGMFYHCVIFYVILFRDYLKVRQHKGIDPIISIKRDYDDGDGEEMQQYSDALDSFGKGKTNQTTNS